MREQVPHISLLCFVSQQSEHIDCVRLTFVHFEFAIGKLLMENFSGLSREAFARQFSASGGYRQIVAKTENLFTAFGGE